MQEDHQEDQRPEIKMHRVATVAKQTGMSRGTIWNRIRDGTLETAKVKNCRLITDRSVRKMVGQD
jgi:hypothetical protein